MSSALTDNWLLELACHALAGNPRPGHGGPINISISEESVSALLHFLDLTIFYDTIFYDDEWFRTWDHLLTGTARQVLSPVKRSQEEKRELRAHFEQQEEPPRCKYDSSLSDVVEGGAYFYLGLASSMGGPYWPSPPRADFLRQHTSFRTGPFFSIGAKTYLEEQLRRIEDEVLKPLSVSTDKLRFMGLSTIVLANTDTSDNLLKVALEIRDTREAKELRKWLTHMEDALANGDIFVVNRGAADLKHLVESIRSGLGLENGSSSEVELEVGLAPTITVGAATLRRMVSRIRPQPLHLTFLRSLLEDNLKNLNTRKHLSRLFPTKESSNSVDAAASSRFGDLRPGYSGGYPEPAFRRENEESEEDV